MNVFTSISTNLPKDQSGKFYAFSGQEYLVYGYTNQYAKTLTLDGKYVNIAPVTFYWEKKVKAPEAGAQMIVEHLVQVFGGTFEQGNISSAANLTHILVKPSCNL